MKKKLLVALALSAVVLAGCGTNESAKEQVSASEEIDESKEKYNIEEREDDNKNSEENAGDSTKFNFGKEGEIAIVINSEQSIMVYVRSEDVNECSLAFAYYYSSLSVDDMSNYDTSILCSCGNDLSVMWIKTDNVERIVGINSDGSSTSELPDWIITDAEKFTLSEAEQANILTEIQESTLKFLKQ